MADEKDITKYADNFAEFSEKLIEQYRPVLAEIERTLFNDLLILLSSYNFTDATSLDVAGIVAEIDKLFINVANSPEFVNDTRQFLQNFDTVRANALTFQKEINSITYTPQFYTSLDKAQKFLVDKTLYDLQQGALKKYFVEDAKQILLEAAYLGNSQKQIEKRLRKRFLSSKDKDSYYMRYATQISRDSVNEYHGQVNQMIADEYGLDMIRYVGSTVEDSREFCMHVIKQMKGVIKRSELPKLLTRYSGSNGMKPNTDVNNFLIVRGGYNCRHEAIPFRSKTV